MGTPKDHASRCDPDSVIDGDWARDQRHVAAMSVASSCYEGLLRNHDITPDLNTVLIVNPHSFTDPAVVAYPQLPGEADSCSRPHHHAGADVRAEGSKRRCPQARADLPRVRYEDQFYSGPDEHCEQRAVPGSPFAGCCPQPDDRDVASALLPAVVAHVMPLRRQGANRSERRCPDVSIGLCPRVVVRVVGGSRLGPDAPSACYVLPVPHRLSVLLVGLNYAPETTGIAPYSAGLAEELHRRQGRVRVVTAYPHYPQWTFGSDRLPWTSRAIERGVRVDRLRHLLPKSPGGVWRGLSEISFGLATCLTRFGRPDVLVLVSPALLSTAVVMMRTRLTHRKTPVIVWVQDLYSLGLRELDAEKGFLASAVKTLERWVLREADKVVVIHERFRDTVVDDLGVESGAVEVVRNWSHTAWIDSPDRDLTRARYGWGEADFVVLHAGNMGLKQGLENVVSAARLARERGSAVRFVLVGDGNQRESLKNLSAAVDSLEMISPLPDPEFQEVLGAADALLVNERPGVAGMAVPSKLTTYFGTGLPVIGATDAGSVTESEMLQAGAGPVVRAGDPAALLDAAERLALDPEAAKAMGARARDFRASRLSAEASFDRFASLLQGLAQGRTPSTAREAGTA